MNEARELALTYLRTPPGAPWRWEDGGRALVWRDGATIAFREELEAIFERLTPGGLPPFSALVCVLAACRGRYLDFPAKAEMAADGKQMPLAGFSDVLSARAEMLAVEQLRKLAALPREVIGQTRGKALLAQIVFEATERGGGADAGRVAKGMQAGLGDAELNAKLNADGARSDEAPLDVVATIHAAAQPLRGHTAESLRLRLQTGLDVTPGAEAVEIALPRSERARRLWANLAEDEESGGLARVARDLMAAIRLPGMLARADEQAAGGAAGLGNRGTLDRLLLSELAHDDLTLATRVALNEALYLHREPPAKRPRRGLALLLDAGLRMWGVPRLLGAAAGLALLSGWPDEAEASVWRADDEGMTPVDLLEEKGLAAHLAALGLGLHPGAVLADFLAKVEAAGERDVVIVTHRQALGDEAFRRRLAALNIDRAFLVTVEHAGLVQLHALPWGGEGARPLVSVQVDVAKLGEGKRASDTKAARPSAAALADPTASLDLPGIFRARPFPLLLPVTGKLEKTVACGEGGLCVSGDRNLYRWARAGLGARLLMADMPGGRTCLLQGEAAHDGRIIVVRGRDKAGKMAVVSFADEDAAPNVARVIGPHLPPGVHVDRTAILLVMHTRVTVVALDASEVLGETPMPEGLRAIGGRYAVDVQDLWFASWDGSRVRWDKTEMGRHVTVGEIVGAFGRDGVGPWVVTRDRRILGPAGNEWMRLNFEPVAVSVLRDGNELMIQVGDKNATRYHVDLPNRRSWPVPANLRAMDSSILLQPPARQLHCRIEAIHAAPGQALRLRNAKGRWLELFAQQDGLRLVTAAGASSVLNAEAKRFDTVSAQAALGCKLKRVKWPDGSCAWLDDRGLLHLRSRNPDVPEFTLVLGVGLPVAGWSSDGMIWGPEFFTGKKDGTHPAVALGLVTRFSESLC